jgi:aarF domain-containing kinase
VNLSGLADGLPKLDASGLAQRLPNAGGVQLPSATDLKLPSVQLPSVQLPSVQLPDKLPDTSAVFDAVRGTAASAVEAAQHLPEEVAVRIALLQQLLSSAPDAIGGSSGAGALSSLEPHFGTRAAEALLSQLGATSGARGALPPMMQLPTGADAIATGGLVTGVDPADLAAALTSAWGTAGDQAAALLPPAAAAALTAGAAVAVQQHAVVAAAAAAQAGSLVAAADQLRAAAAALPDTGFGGVDFPTLCFAAAGALLATALSIPPPDYEASATAPAPGGSSGSSSRSDPRDPPLTHDYNPEAMAAYFRRRPVAVAARAARLASQVAALGLAVAGDFATGRVAANERARAEQLRGAIERLGPAYVKVAQVRRAGTHHTCWQRWGSALAPATGLQGSQRCRTAANTAHKTASGKKACFLRASRPHPWPSGTLFTP